VEAQNKKGEGRGANVSAFGPPLPSPVP